MFLKSTKKNIPYLVDPSQLVIDIFSVATKIKFALTMDEKQNSFKIQINNKFKK